MTRIATAGRLVAAAALLAAVAVPAHAQRSRGTPTQRLDKPHIVTADSVERLNPISPLIERRKEIGIPDSVVIKLGAILSQLDATNSRMLRQVDSLADNPGGPPAISDEAQREGARAPRGIITLDFLIGQIGKNNDVAGAQVLTLLSGDAAKRARKVMDDQRKKLQQLLFDSGVGRGSG